MSGLPFYPLASKSVFIIPYSYMQMPQVLTAGTVVVAAGTENVLTEDGQSSESVMTALHSGSSPDNDDGSDISLKLSYVYSKAFILCIISNYETLVYLLEG